MSQQVTPGRSRHVAAYASSPELSRGMKQPQGPSKGPMAIEEPGQSRQRGITQEVGGNQSPFRPRTGTNGRIQILGKSKVSNKTRDVKHD